MRLRWLVVAFAKEFAKQAPSPRLQKARKLFRQW